MSIVKCIARVPFLVLAAVLAVERAAAIGPPPPTVQCKHPVLGMIEGPDPITGLCAWDTSGASVARDDSRRPGRDRRIARDPSSGRVAEVWAARAGDDHDIALGEWDDDAKGSVVYLTATLTDDLDPAAAFDSTGALHVVWWSRGERDEVVHARRDPASGGWRPDRIVARDARTPALAVDADRVWIAWVRDGSGGRVEIVLETPGRNGDVDRAVVARPLGDDVTDLVLEVRDGRPHLAWTEGDGRIVRAERRGRAWVLHGAGPPVR
jgi:hypothetical protein